MYQKYPPRSTEVSRDAQKYPTRPHRIGFFGKAGIALATGALIGHVSAENGLILGEPIIEEVLGTSDAAPVISPPSEPEPYPMLSDEIEELAQEYDVISNDQHIRCEDMPTVDNIWTGGKVYKWYVGDKVYTNGYMHINKEVCDNYKKSLYTLAADDILNKDEAFAHIVIEHESQHLINLYDSEAIVQCHALQKAANRLFTLGASEVELSILKESVAAFNASMGTEYQSADCSIDGNLDLTPGQLYNDIGDVWLPFAAIQQ